MYYSDYKLGSRKIPNLESNGMASYFASSLRPKLSSGMSKVTSATPPFSSSCAPGTSTSSSCGYMAPEITITLSKPFLSIRDFAYDKFNLRKHETVRPRPAPFRKHGSRGRVTVVAPPVALITMVILASSSSSSRGWSSSYDANTYAGTEAFVLFSPFSVKANCSTTSVSAK